MSTPYDGRNSKQPKILTPGSGRDAPDLSKSDLSRILPRQMSTGSTRGTQTVGYGDTKIDGSNNRITLGNGSGTAANTGSVGITLDGNNSVITIVDQDGSSVGMGIIPDSGGQFGFFSMDADGHVMMKIVNGSFYSMDAAGHTVMRIVDGALIMNDTLNDRVILGKSDGAF